jgi:hypothetical protein
VSVLLIVTKNSLHEHGQNDCPVEAIATKVPPGFVKTEPVTTQTFPGEVTLSLMENVPNEYSSEYSIELSSQFVI